MALLGELERTVGTLVVAGAHATGKSALIARLRPGERAPPSIEIDSQSGVESLLAALASTSADALPSSVLLVLDAMRPASPSDQVLLGWALGQRRVPVVLAINKLDAVGYDYDVYRRYRAAILERVRPAGGPDPIFVPTSATRDENITITRDTAEWYAGPTLSDVILRAAASHALVRPGPR